MTDDQRSRERGQQDTRQQQPPQQPQPPPPPQTQQREREAEQPREAQRSQPQSQVATEKIVDVAQQVQAGKQSAFKAGQATITLGRAGEHNLSVEWIDVNLTAYMSARFDVKTAPENALEVQVEQDVYKRSYGGNGAVSTPVLPGAPTGTTGKLTARDTTTGETLVVPWVWYNMGGGSRGPGLWATIKRLIWRSGGQ